MDEVVLKRLTISLSMQTLQTAERKTEQIVHEPVGYNNVDLVCEILTDLEAVEETPAAKSGELQNLPEIQELMEILYSTDFQALMEAHDTIANKTYEEATPTETLMEPGPVKGWKFHECPFPGPESVELSSTSTNTSQLTTPMLDESNVEDGIRLVGLRRGRNSNLQGLTVRTENGQLIIARILAGSPIDKQGLLHVGDVIKEVNGYPVKSPAALQQAVLCQPDTVLLKVIPTWNLPAKVPSTFVRAYISYEPRNDPLLPSSSMGLKFAKGDILEILNVEDDAYWQARHYGDSGSAKLIPSQALQEQRSARTFDTKIRYHCNKSRLPFLSKKKTEKVLYGNQENWINIDRHELTIYEEVLRVPAFPRKAVVLIGPLGNARRKLVSKLIRTFPERYGYPLPRTSRKPRPNEQDGREYYFNSLDEMKRDIAANQYAEYGEYNGNLYGTKIDSIRYIVISGKTCVLDCSPQCMKLLRKKEFMPYVVFVAQADFSAKDVSTNGSISARSIPSDLRSATMDNLKTITSYDDSTTVKDPESKMLLETYEAYVDLVLNSDNCDECFNQLLHALTIAELDDQWIPVEWIY